MIRKNDKKDKKGKIEKPVVYVKPVLSYDQIVEIIDERIAAIEKASEKKEKRGEPSNHKDKSKDINE